MMVCVLVKDSPIKQQTETNRTNDKQNDKQDTHLKPKDQKCGVLRYMKEYKQMNADEEYVSRSL